MCAEACIEGVRQPPGEHPAGGPVHDRHQVQEALLDGDVGDVRRPRVIGPLDGQSLEPIGVNPVLGVRPGGPRRLVDGLKPHQAHQTPHPVTPHTDAFAPQMTDPLAATIEWALQEQLVDPAHQRQILRALALGPVVHRGSAHTEQVALTAQAELGMAGLGHPPALLPAHHLSPLAKKSRSTVSSPIFACRSRISSSCSPRDRSAPFEKTSFIPSTVRCFQVLTWFGWTLCRVAISWIVLSPRSASSVPWP